MLTSLLRGTAVLSLLVGAPAFAQTPTPEPAPAAAAQAMQMTDADPALWVVKDDDTTIYLFGTVHILKPGLSWFDEAVKTAFDSADTLVLEMVPPEQAEAQATVMKYALNPTGPTLTEKLPEDKRAAYGKAMTDLGLPPAAFDRFDPWFAATNLGVVTMMKAGYDPNSGSEPILTKAATDTGKPIEGLETFEQQLGYFDTLPDDMQITFLTTTIDELPEANANFGKLIDSWAQGDEKAVGDLMNEGMRETPEIAKILLADRNERWATWIDDRLDTPGTVFVAVGAGHLSGPDSVQMKLGTHQLTATRVDY